MGIRYVSLSMIYRCCFDLFLFGGGVDLFVFLGGFFSFLFFLLCFILFVFVSHMTTAKNKTMANFNIIDPETLLFRKKTLLFQYQLTVQTQYWIQYLLITVGWRILFWRIYSNKLQYSLLFVQWVLATVPMAQTHIVAQHVPVPLVENNYSIIFLFSLFIMFCLCELHVMVSLYFYILCNIGAPSTVYHWISPNLSIQSC